MIANMPPQQTTLHSQSPAAPPLRFPPLFIPDFVSVQVFSTVIDKLYAYVHPKTGKKAGLIADDVYEIIQKNKQRLNSALIMDRDFDYDYFGFKTLER